MWAKVAVTLTAALALTSCGSKYNYERVLADGSSCTVTVYSSRDMQDGGLNIGTECQVHGSAASLSTNDLAYEVMNNLVGKIP